MPELMTKTQFARYVGCSPSTVQDALRRELSKAMIGQKIDAEHFEAQLFKDNQQADVTERGWDKHNKEKKARAAKQSDLKKAVEAAGFDLTPPDYLLDYLDYTLEKIVMMHGTEPQFLDFLKATKEIELIQEKRLKNSALEGTLISRELVLDHVLGPINTAHLKMMTDGSATIAHRCVQKIKAGSDEIELRDFIKQQIGSFIKPLKNKIERTLRDA